MKIPNLLQILLGIATTFLLMKVTIDGFQKNTINKLFKIDGQTQNDRQMALMALYALYFALFIIAMKVLEWISTWFNLKEITATIQRIIKNSFDYFIILGLIMFYLMRNNNKQYFNRKIILYAFWFILGRILFAIGFLLTTLLQKFDINGKIVGVALIYAEVTMMIADICGYDSFKPFTAFDLFGQDL